jgi:hypothetical protein
VRAVSGAHDREVSLVERGDGGLAVTLTEGDCTGVDEPQIEVLVGLLQFGGARQVGIRWVRYSVCASVDVGNEVAPHFDAAELDQPVVDLDEYRARYKQVLRSCEQVRAAAVVGVLFVEGRDDWPCVEDERHAERKSRASGCSCSAATAMLVSARKVARRGRRSRLSSSARSATTAPSILPRESPRLRAS